jgi:excisionase family DNA binding protein
MTDAKRLSLTLRECAGRLGVNYETARRWASQGRLPVFKFNGVGRWRAYAEDIDAFIAKHQNTAATWSAS